MRIRHSASLKEQVRILRSSGKTYSEITKELEISIPKSTISSWCNKIILPIWYQNKVDELNKKSFSKAQKMAWVSNKIKRERFLEKLIENKEVILRKLNDQQTLKLLLSMLYLGEGSKWKSHRGLMLGSSDPNIIKLYIRLLETCYGVISKNLRCRVSYRADQDISVLQKYWSKITLVPLSNFYKTKPDPRTIGKPTKNKNYMGVCVITCGGTHIQLELEAIPKIILKGL